MMDTKTVSGEQPGAPGAPTTSPDKPATYSLYGLRVRSDLLLPLAPIENDGADLIVRFEGLIPRSDGPPPRTMTRVWQRQGGQWVLRFRGQTGHVLEFRYDLAGTQISIRQSYPKRRDTLFALMCPALAAALHLQGRPALHATSLVNNGGAFLLMGLSGTGKSTLAAALAVEGLSFHSDDIAALSWEAGVPVVQAGYPRLKITSQTGESLGWPADALLHIFVMAPEYPEKWVDAAILQGGFHDGPAPLKTIYLLSGRSADLQAPRLETLSPGQAALALVRHLYGQPWLGKPAAQAMKLCARLAVKTPIRRLWLPDGLENLRPAARAIMTDMP